MGAFVRPRGGVGTAIPIMDFWGEDRLNDLLRY